jgi:hypothetical protein
VIGGNVVPEGEVELVVVDDVGLGISLSKTAAEYGGSVTLVTAR